MYDVNPQTNDNYQDDGMSAGSPAEAEPGASQWGTEMPGEDSGMETQGETPPQSPEQMETGEAPQAQGEPEGEAGMTPQEYPDYFDGQGGNPYGQGGDEGVIPEPEAAYNGQEYNPYGQYSTDTNNYGSEDITPNTRQDGMFTRTGTHGTNYQYDQPWDEEGGMMPQEPNGNGFQQPEEYGVPNDMPGMGQQYDANDGNDEISNYFSKFKDGMSPADQDYYKKYNAFESVIKLKEKDVRNLVTETLRILTKKRRRMPESIVKLKESDVRNLVVESLNNLIRME